MKRKVNAIWQGGGADGQGILTAQSGAFNEMPYSFKTRFENDNGVLGTNPEELIAAALAGCFNMKLSFVLNENNFHPIELNTDAILIFEDGKIVGYGKDILDYIIADLGVELTQLDLPADLYSNRYSHIQVFDDNNHS